MATQTPNEPTTLAKAPAQPQETDPRVKSVQAYLFQRKIQLERVMPRGELTVDRLIATALMSCKKVDALLRCEPESIFLSVMDAAELGLTVHWGPRGEAVLVPFGTKCTLMIGYRGLLICARRGANLREIAADVCRENDGWRYEVTHRGQMFKHIPMHDEAEARLYYAAAWFRESPGCQVTVVTKQKVARIRDMVLARAKDKDSPWKNWPVEMGIKTAIRQLMKTLPSYDTERALELEEQHAKERGEVVDGTVVERDQEVRTRPPPRPSQVIEVRGTREQEPARVERVQETTPENRAASVPSEAAPGPRSEGTAATKEGNGAAVADSAPARPQAATGSAPQGDDPDSFTDRLIRSMREAAELGSDVALKKTAERFEEVPEDRQTEVMGVYGECKRTIKARMAERGGGGGK